MRVILDYEIKRDLNRDLALLGAENDNPERKREIAEKHGLAMVNGKIPVPDMRLEYEDSELRLQRVDLELATREYRPRSLAEKAKAGFAIYGRAEDAARLREFWTSANSPGKSSRYEHRARPPRCPESPRLHRSRGPLSLYRSDPFWLFCGAPISRLYRARIGVSARRSFGARLNGQKHARTERFPKSGTIHHLFSRRLYRQIEKENLRNRRVHELDFIKRRIAILDFVLANQQYDYLETEPQKVSYFCDSLGIDSRFFPARLYLGRNTPRSSVRYFVDKFPMFFASPRLW